MQLHGLDCGGFGVRLEGLGVGFAMRLVSLDCLMTYILRLHVTFECQYLLRVYVSLSIIHIYRVYIPFSSVRINRAYVLLSCVHLSIGSTNHF